MTIKVTNDHVSHAWVRRLAATLGEPCPDVGEALPWLWHWAFFQDAPHEAQLGVDGHPAGNDFLSLPAGCSRMWAGGRLSFLHPLQVGETAERHSRIISREEKAGRSGTLLFVTLEHTYWQAGRLAIREEQDIVYRPPAPPRLIGAELPANAAWQETLQPSATLLFRYSALTFNSHRIHYDWPYATEVEHYPGLVVQGPLIATLSLAAFCRANPQAHVHGFSFRGVCPLICPQSFELGGRLLAPGDAEVWAAHAGSVAQQGRVSFS